MASLTYVAHTSRNIIKFGSLSLIGLSIVWIGAVASIKAYKAANPPYIAPTVKYGAIPKLIFPEKEFTKKNFVKELPNDTFPKFSDQAKVFIIYRSNRNLFAYEEDVKTAKTLGFTDNPIEVKTNIYEFKNGNNQVLTMDIIQGSFTLAYPFQNDQIVLNPEKLPDKNGAITITEGFLRNANKLPGDIDTKEAKVTFWKIQNDGLKASQSKEGANAVRVDLFRKKINDEIKIVTSEPDRAAISALVSGSTIEGKKILQLNYKYAPYDKESFSTYPIKPVETAWNELKEGKYWPANDVSTSSVTIRNIYLAYFEPVSLTNYLQPVYVFEGDGKFVAYVSAISDKYLK